MLFLSIPTGAAARKAAPQAQRPPPAVIDCSCKGGKQVTQTRFFSRLFILSLLLVALLQATPGTLAQNADAVRARYTKYEYLIPMRDGVRLFTQLYVPKDTSQRYPFLLTRTPYSVSPYGVDFYRAALGPSEQFEKEGFIFV